MIAHSSGVAKADATTSNPLPFDKASFLSRAVHWWVNPLMKLGHKQALGETDMWQMPEHMKAQYVSNTIHRHLDDIRKSEAGSGLGASSETTPLIPAQDPVTASPHGRTKARSSHTSQMFKAMFLTFQNPWLLSIFFLALSTIGEMICPLFIQAIMRYLARCQRNFRGELPVDGPTFAEGVVLALGQFLLQFGSCIVFHQAHFRDRLIYSQVTAGLREMISTKSLSRWQFTDGRVNTMMSSDIHDIAWAGIIISDLTIIPPGLILGCILVYYTLGPASLIGIGLLVITIPYQRYVLLRQRKLKHSQNKSTDQRANLLSQIINNFPAIRFYGYENLFSSKIQERRKAEIKEHSKVMLHKANSTAVVLILPIIAAMVSLIVHKLLGNELEPAAAFTTLHYFATIQMFFKTLANCFPGLSSGWTSLDRVTDYLNAEETTTSNNIVNPSQYLVRVRGSFQHQTTQEAAPTNIQGDTSQPITRPFCIKDIDITVPHEKNPLICIVGMVGTGKSTLLLSLLKQIQPVHGGAVEISGKVSYVPQTAWIQSGSIRFNITFAEDNETIDEDYLQEVIDSCGLRQDVEAWPYSVLTQIGERGITISGGQAQRLCLARAAYSRSNIVLMDDPLSAVDAETGLHLMTKCILDGPLAKQTRFLVTHQLNILPKADQILFMNIDKEGNGFIEQSGSYWGLMNETGPFRKLIEASQSTSSENDSSKQLINDTKQTKETATLADNAEPDFPEVQLFGKETAHQGSIDSAVYKGYFHAIHSQFLVGVICALVIAQQLVWVANYLWLGYWTEGKLVGLSQFTQMSVYGGIGLVFALMTWASMIAVGWAGYRASLKLFDDALRAVLRSPLRWYTQTPTGRIINRFTADINTTDHSIAQSWYTPADQIARIMAIFCLAVLVYPSVALVMIPFPIYAVYVGRYWLQSSRAVRRWKSVFLSDVYSVIGEQLSGALIIQIFNQEKQFAKRMRRAVDRQVGAEMTSVAFVEWLGMRVHTCYAMLPLTLFGILNRYHLDPAQFGAILAYSMMAFGPLGYMTSKMSDLETEMAACERILEYSKLEPEVQSEQLIEPGSQWPENGSIDVKNVSMRYRPGLPTILRNVSFKVQPGEKVAILGRTGAGKSSITHCLFRTTDICGGSIEIDGLDIAQVNLQTLRNRMTIIPQKAFLYGGSVRENIDPEGQATDAKINDVLNLIQNSADVSGIMKDKLKLDARVDPDGANFSAGERQLLALMRAIVRGTKIMVMDEATSSVDTATDALIQRIIQTELKDITLLAIAHRLQTVAYYDRIIIMEAGQIVETDTPLNLFDRPGSLFRQFCDKKQLSRNELLRIRADAGKLVDV